ncbi:hypothetical protein B296_00030889, partial [Ensete ventricosum]
EKEARRLSIALFPRGETRRRLVPARGDEASPYSPFSPSRETKRRLILTRGDEASPRSPFSSFPSPFSPHLLVQGEGSPSAKNRQRATDCVGNRGRAAKRSDSSSDSGEKRQRRAATVAAVAENNREKCWQRKIRGNGRWEVDIVALVGLIECDRTRVKSLVRSPSLTQVFTRNARRLSSSEPPGGGAWTLSEALGPRLARALRQALKRLLQPLLRQRS